jgi:hypothetical protein
MSADNNFEIKGEFHVDHEDEKYEFQYPDETPEQHNNADEEQHNNADEEQHNNADEDYYYNTDDSDDEQTRPVTREYEIKPFNLEDYAEPKITVEEFFPGYAQETEESQKEIDLRYQIHEDNRIRAAYIKFLDMFIASVF